jgi:hypothetical protein
MDEHKDGDTRPKMNFESISCNQESHPDRATSGKDLDILVQVAASVWSKTCNAENEQRFNDPTPQQGHHGLPKGFANMSMVDFDGLCCRRNLWNAVSDQEKREIIDIYGSELPTEPPGNRVCGIREIRNRFRLYNPNFFRYFFYADRQGKWMPNLGKEGELSRRQHMWRYHHMIMARSGETSLGKCGSEKSEVAANKISQEGQRRKRCRYYV